MSGTRGTILVVDDDRDFRAAIAAILAAGGYRAIIEKDAARVSITTEEQKPDLVLLDLNMPGRPGIETIRGMREASLDTPVVILSGRVEEEQKLQLQALQISGILTKPVSMKDLIDKVEQVLAECPEKNI